MTGIIQSKGGGGERCTEIRNIEVPDLWHIAMHCGQAFDKRDDINIDAEKMILECWHLAHDMKTILQALDKVLPLMLQRATERIKELITDIQEMGDVEQLTVDNLNSWAEELSDYTGLFDYLPMGGDFMGSERNEAEHYIGEAMRLAEEISKEIDDASVDNNYVCPCGNKWGMTWSCQCNDKCGECGREIEPEVYP